MHAYILYQIATLDTADLNRRAEIHRIVNDARRERRADRQQSGRPGTVLHHLLPAALSGSRR